LLMTRKLVARYLANSGFGSGTAVSIDVLSEIIIKHICKLGRNLKLLTDSYRKQFSSVELLKMFLQTVGYSNIGPLMEITKMGNRVANYPVHQDAQVLQSQHPNSLLHAQQLPRQFPPQLLQNLTPQQQQQLQNLTPQQQQLLQQQHWLRRSQLTSPRGPLTMADKNQPMVNVKIENTMDSQIDGSYGSFSRQQQLNLRQQQQLLHHQQQQLQQQHLQQQQQQLQQQQHQQQLNQQQQQLQQQQQHINQQQQQLNQQQQLQQQHHLTHHHQQQLQQQQQQLNQQQHLQQQQQLSQQHQMTMSANQNAQLAQQFK
jgi:hypothetical protein